MPLEHNQEQVVEHTVAFLVSQMKETNVEVLPPLSQDHIQKRVTDDVTVEEEISEVTQLVPQEVRPGTSRTCTSATDRRAQHRSPSASTFERVCPTGEVDTAVELVRLAPVSFECNNSGSQLMPYDRIVDGTWQRDRRTVTRITSQESCFCNPLLR